jgi:hypothetical protein
MDRKPWAVQKLDIITIEITWDCEICLACSITERQAYASGTCTMLHSQSLMDDVIT